MPTIFGKRRKREDQARRLVEHVESRPDSRGEREQAVAFGRGILEEMTPGLGPHVTDSVFVLTEEAFYYQYLEETPKQLKSARAIATGVTPAEWKQLARESTTRIAFTDLESAEGQRAVDGRWDLLFVPKNWQSESDFIGFGVAECYGKPALSPEHVANLVRFCSPSSPGHLLAELLDRLPFNPATAAMEEGHDEQASLAEVAKAMLVGEAMAPIVAKDQARARREELARFPAMDYRGVNLSSAILDDVPESVRIGSPYDSSDDEVVRVARTKGILHPGTNYGVVYRVAFAKRLEPREEPITMRVMFAASEPAAGGVVRKPTTDDMAWLLVTSAALRWHFVVDGVPGTAENREAPRPRGPRNAPYESIRPIDIGLERELVSQQEGPFGAAAFDFVGFYQTTMSGDWIHAFGIAPGFESDALLREIHERIADASLPPG